MKHPEKIAVLGDTGKAGSFGSGQSFKHLTEKPHEMPLLPLESESF
jgi:hypothetical protein